MVLQLQRDKESKGLQSLLPPAPGPAASQLSHVCLSVCACCFIWGAEQKPAPCPVLRAERCSFTCQPGHTAAGRGQEGTETQAALVVPASL